MNVEKKIRNIYLYIKKDKIQNCLKYGIKLSDFSNVYFNSSLLLNKGILAYISPKDSDKYNDDSYDILRISTNTLRIYIRDNNEKYNALNNKLNIKDMYNLSDYILGQFINPEAIICSSIMPENIFRYNRIIDVPLLIDNSKELYFDVKMENENENSFNNLTFDKLLKQKNKITN